MQRAGRDLEKPLISIGWSLANDIQVLFDESRDPWGRPWKPLKYREGKPLRNTGVHLQQTIGPEVVDGQHLEVGTRTPWAGIHQFGGKAGRGRKVRIPARPFLPLKKSGVSLPDHMRDTILRMLSDHFEEAVS